MISTLRRLPLTIRLPIVTAVLMVLVGLVASQQVLSALGRVQDTRLRELAQLHVGGLSVALGPLVLRRDVWEVYDTLDRAAQAGEGRRMVFTAVAADDGRVLAATEPLLAPVDSPIADLANEAKTLDELRVLRADQVSLVAPLVYQGRTVGEIVTQLDIADLQAERRRALALLLVGNALATGLLAVGGYLAMRRMLHPVGILANAMTGAGGTPQKISGKDLPSGDSEVAQLMHTYNAMAGAVEAKAEAERRLAERERFVALGRLSQSLAHEINNPLSGLLNATDTIRSYPDRSDVVLKSADLLDRGLRHLRDVARATLDQSRYDRSKASLSATDFEDLQFLIRPEVSRQGQTLCWAVDPLDASGLGLDSGPIRQIALNLLLNASAAAGRGGEVRLDVTFDPTGLHLAVEDNGPGLPEDALQRLTTSAPVQPGGGVGLRLVRDLVLEHRGKIIHRRQNGRTRIAVSLPVLLSRGADARG